MATQYTIGATAALLAPSVQRWRRVQVDTDHSKRAIYSGNEEIDLEFDSASITMARQWLEATSGGSLNLTILGRWNLGYVDLSGVYLEINQYPSIEAGVAGNFTLIVKGASVGGG